MNLKPIVKVLLLILLAGATLIYWFALGPALKIATGYHAEILGSAVFLSGRDPEHIQSEDLSFLSFVQGVVDLESGTVESSVYGLAKSRAIHRPGYGVTLVHQDEAALRAQPSPAPMVIPENRATAPWPEGDAPGVTGTTTAALETALDHYMTNPNPEKPWNTRALVVIKDGKLIAERYADGFNKDTRLTGWSMTKSVTNALIGILVRQGKLDIHQPATVAEWQNPGDERAQLTTDVLLRMSSGLEFAEEYFNPFADATKMLFASPSASAVAAAKPLAHAPDTVWSYASGTTNILARIVREASGDANYADFANRELFAPLGMYSAVLCSDEGGDFVGSSFGWATARDWARFGLLFLNDGVWNGTRILPEGWVAYSVTPTPPAPQGSYGAQWWLNAGTPEDPADRPIPSAPTDLYFASGFEGQRIFVLPSQNAIIVKLSLTQQSGAFDWDAFLKRMIEALPETEVPAADTAEAGVG